MHAITEPARGGGAPEVGGVRQPVGHSSQASVTIHTGCYPSGVHYRSGVQLKRLQRLRAKASTNHLTDVFAGFSDSKERCCSSVRQSTLLPSNWTETAAFDSAQKVWHLAKRGTQSARTHNSASWCLFSSTCRSGLGGTLGQIWLGL